MVRPDVAVRKVDRALGWLREAEALISSPLEEFLADVQRRDLASFYLFLSIQEIIDLGVHWVSDAGLTPPDDAASAFDIIADRGEIDRELADRLRGAVGLRNRIAHGYAAVDHNRLYAEFRQGVDTLRRFLAAVSETAGI